jgi:homoserine kinase type II
LNIVNDELIKNEIILDIKKKFSWTIHSANPIYLGYGNLKWVFETDNDAVFVKQYNKIRYRRGLDGVRQALKVQHLMHLDGIPCRPLYRFEDEYILTTSSGEEYMISGVSEGKLVEAGQVNGNQMYSLGEATGRMHVWMRTNMPQLQALQWELPSKEKMLDKVQMNLSETKKANNERYSEAIEKQIIILKNLDMDIFNACKMGWAHWDMHVDNIMFHEDKVADILDFDRLHFVYPDFDISRAILSGALSNQTLNTDTTRAFIEGYRKYHELSVDRLIRSMKLTWYKECKWIVEQFQHDPTMARFIDEMIWIGDEWYNLEEIFNVFK